jgi:MipA family protein
MRRLLAFAFWPLAAGAAELPLWELGAGAGGLRLPHYRGSDRSQSWLLPVPFFVYRGEILKADRNGARALLLDTERIEVDISANASAPAKSDNDPAREGMPDLAPTLELGPKVNLTLARAADWKLDLRLPLRGATTLQRSPRFIGWTLSPVLNLDWHPGLADFGFQGGPIWGDRRYHRYFYSVAPAYATASRPAYEAPAGYAGWQATAAFSRRRGALWMGGYLRRDSVGGAAFESSPLVTSRQQWSVGFAVAWVFAASDKLVTVED